MMIHIHLYLKKGGSEAGLQTTFLDVLPGRFDCLWRNLLQWKSENNVAKMPKTVLKPHYLDILDLQKAASNKISLNMPDISIFSKHFNQMWKTNLNQKKGGVLLEAAKKEEPEKFPLLRS